MSISLGLHPEIDITAKWAVCFLLVNVTTIVSKVTLNMNTQDRYNSILSFELNYSSTRHAISQTQCSSSVTLTLTKGFLSMKLICTQFSCRDLTILVTSIYSANQSVHQSLSYDFKDIYYWQLLSFQFPVTSLAPIGSFLPER